MYGNFILLADLNSEPKEQTVQDFCQAARENIIKENTCFKNPANPSYIDLFLTNRPACFHSSVNIETGLFNFHKMSLSMMKVFCKKRPPNIVRYCNYNNFNNKVFINDLNEYFTENTEFLSFDSFKRTIDKTLEKYTLLKKQYVRAKQAPFINKNINKEIMKRSRLRNKFLNTKSDIDSKAYNKQRNICVTLIRQEKKKLNTRFITDNKTFWKKVKPFLQIKYKLNLK